MDKYSRNEQGCPQLLDLIPSNRDWLMQSAAEQKSHGHGVSEEKKLELSLGPPGGDWNIQENNTNNKNNSFVNSFGYFAQNPSSKSPWPQAHFFHVQSSHHNHLSQAQKQLPLSVMKETTQLCSNRELQCASAEKKAFSPISANNTAVNNTTSAQKRTAPAPVVGWPPVRSFRKNLAGGSCKSASESPNDKVSGQKPVETSSKGLFVKINMDGIPIGRKVDLKACDSYEKLSYTVDELFRGLLAAQSNPKSDGMKDVEDGGKAIGGLLNGSGEYTLVYEDNEGDRMLVGDVPWHMFISTVKRLRVLKSSELPKLCRGSKQGNRA